MILVRVSEGDRSHITWENSEVVEYLKKVAPLLGFSSYQPLIRAYIGQGLRVDLERFKSETVTALVASLKRRGVSDTVIDEALNEVIHAKSC